jgi:hypothetical protein
MLCKKQDPSSKITRAKKTRGEAQVTEHLPSKHKAFSSNPRITKRQTKKYLNLKSNLISPVYRFSYDKDLMKIILLISNHMNIYFCKYVPVWLEKVTVQNVI